MAVTWFNKDFMHKLASTSAKRQAGNNEYGETSTLLCAAANSPAAQVAEEQPTVREEFLWDERAVANTSALHLVFLGTGADSRTNERSLAVSKIQEQ